MIDLTKVQIQEAINQLLEKENGLNEVLQMTLNGLMYAERSAFLEEQKENKGNGYRFVKAVGLGKQINLSVPRDRLGVFEPVILALIRDQDSLMKEVSFDLYGKGLTTQQIGEVFDKIYGKHYCSSSISNITKTFYKQMEQWRNRGLNKRYPVIYIDAIHVKIRREYVSSEAFYVILGLNEDFTREVLGVVNIPTESATGWKEVLKSLKKRGVADVSLFVADGLSYLEESIHQEFPTAQLQKCVTHLKRNVLNKVKSKHKEEVAWDIGEVFNLDYQLDTKENAISRLESFIEKWGKYYPHIKNIRVNNISDYYFSYLHFDYRVRRMIYTTNWIERLNKDFRRTLKIRNALPSYESALTLISKVAINKEEKHYKYPIYNFKFDKELSR